MDTRGSGRRSARITSALVSVGGLVVAMVTGAGLWLGHEQASTSSDTSTSSSSSSDSSSSDSSSSADTSTNTDSSAPPTDAATDSGTTDSGTSDSDTGVSQGTTGGASDTTTTGS